MQSAAREKTGCRHISMGDEQLIERALKGEQSAYTLLVNKYSKGLTLFVQDYIKSIKAQDVEFAEEAQDIVQETFQKAFTSLKGYNPEYHFSTWLYSIAKNITIDYSRKRKISIGEHSNNTDNFNKIANIGEGIKNSPEDKMISSQEYMNLIKLINSLDEKYRKPAELRFIKEYAYDEIAQELNLELNTVKTRIKRAKEMLKKHNLL